MDPETGAALAAVITPATVLPPYLENVAVEGISRTSIALQDYPYTLDRGTETQVAVTKSKLLVGSKLTAAATSYALAGQAAGSTYSRKLSAAAGSFTSTGFSAGSIRDYAIGTNAGTFVLAGQNAIVKYQRKPLLAEAGAITLSGQNANFKKAIIKNSLAAAFSLTGADVGSRRGYVLKGDAAEAVLSGSEAGLFISDYFGKWASQTYGYEALVYPDWWAE